MLEKQHAQSYKEKNRQIEELKLRERHHSYIFGDAIRFIYNPTCFCTVIIRSGLRSSRWIYVGLPRIRLQMKRETQMYCHEVKFI